MAGGEHQPQQVVADVVVERGVEVGHLRLAFRGQLVAELGVLAVDQLGAAEAVDRAVLGGGHQPGAGLVGDAGARPLLERGDERVLRQLLGHADVAHHAREAGDELGLLDAEDRVDGVMCIGSRHGYRYQHLQVARASAGDVLGASLCGRAVVRFLELCDVELLHLQESLRHPLRLPGVGVRQHLRQDARDDLPGHAVLVLQPPAGTFLAALTELAPEIVDLLPASRRAPGTRRPR